MHLQAPEDAEGRIGRVAGAAAAADEADATGLRLGAAKEDARVRPGPRRRLLRRKRGLGMGDSGQEERNERSELSFHIGTEASKACPALSCLDLLRLDACKADGFAPARRLLLHEFRAFPRTHADRLGRTGRRGVCALAGLSALRQCRPRASRRSPPACAAARPRRTRRPRRSPEGFPPSPARRAARDGGCSPHDRERFAARPARTCAKRRAEVVEHELGLARHQRGERGARALVRDMASSFSPAGRRRLETSRW